MPLPSKRVQALVVIDDLIFETKIKSTANAVGARVLLVKPGSAVQRLIESHDPALVIVDLASTNEAGLEAIQAARSHSADQRILAYLPHVETELAQRALEHGAHEVLPRARFSQQLPDILSASARQQGASNDIQHN